MKLLKYSGGVLMTAGFCGLLALGGVPVDASISTLELVAIAGLCLAGMVFGMLIIALIERREDYGSWRIHKRKNESARSTASENDTSRKGKNAAA